MLMVKGGEDSSAVSKGGGKILRGRGSDCLKFKKE